MILATCDNRSTMNAANVHYTGNDVDKRPLTNFADRFTGTSRWSTRAE